MDWFQTPTQEVSFLQVMSVVNNKKKWLNPTRKLQSKEEEEKSKLRLFKSSHNKNLKQRPKAIKRIFGIAKRCYSN